MRHILAALKRYAVEPPLNPAPEIVPDEAADPWQLDGAARIALAMLVEGEAPGKRLFDVADYILTFCALRFRDRRQLDALLLNGTALALCGYVCEGMHPEAELWRVAGCARLATEVHARKAALDDTIAADCLQAVCRVADELDLPVLADLITLRERMWGRLLSHSRAERLHVAEPDYPVHMSESVPAKLVGELLQGREWQPQLQCPAHLAGLDVEAADAACENLITLRAHMLVRHQFGSDIDWHLRLFDDKESTVSLGCQSFIRNLVAAFAKTADEKYARHAARLLWSFYRLAPVPNHRQLDGPWRTLEVGNRTANVWPAALGWLGRTSAFDAGTHAMLARSRLEHMRYALAFCGHPNNWYQVESSGLAVSALLSPELRLANAYLRVALRRLKWINSFAYYDDGFQFELTPGYHMFPTSSMFAIVWAARARGVELPGDFTSLVEKAQEMYVYAAQPDFLLPMFNDNGPHAPDPAMALESAAEAFGRDDLHWAATRGEQGSAPTYASHAWPSTGYYVMRDRWGEDGQYVFFDAAPWGASHQHEDKLSFVLYSHGRLMLGDPNIYSYSPTELTHYFKSSRAHNVVMIDGKGQARGQRPESKLSTLGRTEWVSRDALDFVSSEYREGWAEDLFGRGRSEIDHSLIHRRAIFYVKPGYWILTDLILGEDDVPHSLEQIFHIPPLPTPNGPEPLAAGEISVSPERIVTQDKGMPNLAILPVDADGISARSQKGETSPAVGWYGVQGELPAWDVTLECKRKLPARMDAVLFPMAADDDGHPKVEPLRSDASATAFRITGNGLDDTFVLCEDDADPVQIEDITFHGRALLLRREPELRALTVGPLLVEVRGQAVSGGS